MQIYEGDKDKLQRSYYLPCFSSPTCIIALLPLYLPTGPYVQLKNVISS